MKKNTIDNIILFLIILIILSVSTLLTFIITDTPAYAVDLENQGTATNNNYVTFDIGFAAPGSRDIITHSAVANVNPEYTPMYIVIGLVNGCTLTNAQIEFYDSSNGKNLNWDLGFGTVTSECVASSNDTTKTVYLNTLTNGLNFRCTVSPEIPEQVAISKLNETSRAVFTATCIDSSGSTSSVYKEIYFNIGWTGDFTMELSQFVETHTRNSDNTVTIETVVRNMINYTGKRNILPVKQTQIVIDVPTYQGVAPTSVEVTAKKTMATNGKDESNVSFSSSNYNWNSATGKLTITVDNPADASGKVACYRGADEYCIKYIYPQAAYDAFTVPVTITNKMTGTMTLYSNTTTKDITETIDDTITINTEMGSETTAISKKSMYINALTGEIQYYKQFGRILRLSTENTSNTSSFRMEFGQIKFVINGTEYDSYIGGVNYAPITQFTVSIESFTNFLGASGYVRVYDENFNLIGTINSSSTTNSRNEYEFDIPVSYQRSAEKIILETSQPQADLSEIEFGYTRQISGDLPFTFEQLKQLTEMYAHFNLYAARLSDPTNFELDDDSPLVIDEGTFINSYTNAELNVITPVLDASNADEQDLEIKIVLDDLDEVTDVWQNPVFEIEFPSYIYSVGAIEWSISNHNSEVVINIVPGQTTGKAINNRVHIFLSCTGVQKKLFSNQTTITMKCKVKVNKYASNLAQEVKLYYINAAVNEYKNPGTWAATPTSTGESVGFPIYPDGTECGVATSEINFVTDANLLCVTEIGGYNGTDSINSLDDKDTAAVIGRGEINPRMSLIVQNNHTVPVSGITLLGRIPYTGNTYAISGRDLGTTINTTLTSRITQLTSNVSNVTIYYSDNLNATRDLSLPSNNWTTDPASLLTIRSYLIAIDDTLDVGEQAVFLYGFYVPAGTKYKQSLFANFGAYYMVDGVEDTTESSKVGLTTGTGPILTAEKTSSIPEGSTVKEGDIITYTITISNSGEVDAENVVLTDNIPENTTYVIPNGSGGYTRQPSTTTITENIGTIASGDTYTYSFSVIVDAISENGTIENTASITADGIEEIPSTTSSIPTVKSEPNLTVIKTSSIPKGSTVKEGDLITYTITVYNRGTGAAVNVTIKDTIPAGTTYYDTTLNATNPEITEISETKDILNPGESFEVSFTVQVGRINEATEITNIATVTGDNIPDTSSNTHAIPADVSVPNLRAEKTSSITEGQIVKEGDIITYTITVYNDGTTPAYNVVISDIVPDHTIYYENNVKDTSKRTVRHVIPVLGAGEIAIYSFTVIVDEIPENGSIQNAATVNADNSPEITTNRVDIDSQISVPELELEKTSSIRNGATVKTGDVITYTITVTNVGDCNAHDVIISDTVPENTIYAEKVGNQYISDPSRKNISKTIKVLAPGESETLEFSVIVGTLNRNVQISNTATVNANNGEETSSNTVGISAEPKDNMNDEQLPDTGNYSLAIILVIAIVSVGGFSIYEYRRLKKLRR